MKHITVLALAALISLPASLSAQVLEIGIAGRTGTLGLGAEGAIGLSNRLVVRGGIAFSRLNIDPPDVLDPGFYEGVNSTLSLPSKWYTVGVDLYLGTSPTTFEPCCFRFGLGMLFKPDDPTITGTLTDDASIDIGGGVYGFEDITGLTGTLTSKDTAPYVLIGFGKHTSSGLGIFLDLGLALLDEPKVQLTATGNSSLIESSEFQDRLRIEEQSLEDKAGNYLKFWPILNLGLKFGIGIGG